MIVVEVITVMPQQDAWVVKQQSAGSSAIFSSGREAETLARNLADQLVASGRAAEIQIYLRDGSLGGRFVCAPQGREHEVA